MSDEASTIPALLGGRYQVGDRFGGGRMTDVYQGTDTQSSRPVAIKILNADFVEDEAFAQKFVQEAQTFAAEGAGDDGMGHPNLVQLLDAGVDGNTYWVVTELVSGATLAFIERQEPGPMDPKRAIDIAIQVLRGLAFAHGHGVIHRDVTANNILISANEDGSESVKLMDAGISRPTSATTAAQTAATLGSATYISPEIARGGEPFARSDLYSVGVVLYEMLTGRAPFTGDSPVAIAMSHVRETPKRPTELVPSTDQKLDQIIMKALAKNPAERYASADEMRVDLEQVRPSAGAPVGADGMPTEELASAAAIEAADTMLFTSPAAKRGGTSGPNLRLIVAIAVVIGVLLAGAYIFATRTKLVEIPNLIGQTSATAQDALLTAGLQVSVVDRATEEYAPGLVLDQAPPEGTQLPEGDTVTLTVSVPIEDITVESYIGTPLGDAQAMIEAAGLEVGLVSRSNTCTLPAEQVCEQDPPAGTSTTKGQNIDLVVSAGKPTQSVPTLDCLSVEQANNQLQERDFTMVIVGQAANSLCEPGNRIARQDPLPLADPPEDGIVRVWTTENPSATPSPGSPTPASPTPSTPTFP